MSKRHTPQRYGQTLSWDDFQKECADRLKQYVLIKLTVKHVKLARKLWREGYSVADAVGMLILNS